MKLTKNAIEEFRSRLYGYYAEHSRSLPWRVLEADGNCDGYKTLVSEMMLQQTQASRVIPKYRSFLKTFPNLGSLAAAPLSDVLRQWSGLGYNRRAKYLHEAAQNLVQVVQPWSIADLTSQKGIGSNTAKAVLVYSYNQPHVFIETNIRTVIIHHFFASRELVTDQEVELVLSGLMDNSNPRYFYWAMMDYGTMLKKTAGNASRRSTTYAKQSAFHGSKRQVRGAVIMQLANQPLTEAALQQKIANERLALVLMDLLAEGLIVYQNKRYQLP